MSGNYYIFLLILLVSVFFPKKSVLSEDQNRFALGIRAGKSVHLEYDDFESIEAFGEYIYPWKSTFVPGFTLHTRTSLSTGIINQDGDKGSLTTLSQLLVLTNSGNEISFDMGGGFGFVGDDKVGNHNFGTKFQLSYNLGITLHYLFNDVSIGYRWFHLSDGGLGDGQGLNRHIIDLRYEF